VEVDESIIDLMSFFSSCPCRCSFRCTSSIHQQSEIRVQRSHSHFLPNGLMGLCLISIQ